MQWRAFYADGSRYTSVERDWATLPTHGLVIAQWWDNRGRRHLECGDDALINTGLAIVGVNVPTKCFAIAADKEATLGTLKYGTYMDPEAWAALRAEADVDNAPPV